MEAPFPAYSGDDEFVFCCYSHQDSETVYAEIQNLEEANINIWYDEGIRPGSEWTDELANAVRNCSSLLLFATPRSAQSKHCRDEVQYAIKHDKPVIVIYLEPTDLPPGLDLMLGSLHAIEKGTHNQERHLDLIINAIRESQPRGGSKSGPAEVNRTTLSHIKKRGRAPRALVIGLTLAGLAAIALLTLTLGTQQNSDPLIPTRIAAAADTVALLPFENRGGFDDDSYYPESLSEDLLNRLVAIEGLKVASRRSSFTFGQQDELKLPLAEIADTLGVGAIVVGYIRRNGDLIRLSLELIDVSSGTEIVRWSNSYDNQPLTNMLAIQADATTQIAQVFFPAGISSETAERLARVSTSSPEAYDMYLQAQEILRGPLGNISMTENAVGLFTEALELDPNYAWAKAGLCNAHLLIYDQYPGDFADVRESCEPLVDYEDGLFEVRLALGSYYNEIGDIDRAFEELSAASKLNSHSADAKLELARLLSRRFALNKNDLDRIGAEQAFLEAIAAEPNYWFSHHTFATFLLSENRLDEAKAELAKAIQIEPGSVSTHNNLAGIQYRQGLTEAAKKNWQKSLALSEDNRFAFVGLGTLYHYAGEFEQAVVMFRRGNEFSTRDYDTLGRLGESLRLIPGREAEAIDVFSQALALVTERISINPTDWEPRGFQALYYAYIGKPAEAERALTEMFRLNQVDDPMTHYWAALIAYEKQDIEETFRQLDLALEKGFRTQKRFITEEPALAGLRKSHPGQFSQLISRY